jgi:hypothetical protein
MALTLFTRGLLLGGPRIIPPKAFRQIFEIAAILSGRGFADLSGLELSFYKYFFRNLSGLYRNSPSFLSAYLPSESCQTIPGADRRVVLHKEKVHNSASISRTGGNGLQS